MLMTGISACTIRTIGSCCIIFEGFAWDIIKSVETGVYTMIERDEREDLLDPQGEEMDFSG